MSWRRFRALYANLSPQSASFRNYDRAARKLGLNNEAAERGGIVAEGKIPNPAPGRR